MKILILTIGLLCGSLVILAAQDRDKDRTTESVEKVADKKTEKEILAAESKLGTAIASRDASALSSLLADYYADSEEGDERSTGKKYAVDQCKNGTATFYSIDEDRKVLQRKELVIVEGVSHVREKSKNDLDKGEETKIQRVWTKNKGHWQLISQARQGHDE